MKIYDISQEVYGCTVFPGDPSPQKTVVMRVSEGDVCNLSNISMCVHNGTHVDAPYHFIDDGKKIDEISLDKFVGNCYVAKCEGDVTSERAEEIIRLAKDAGKDSYKRILINGKATVTFEAAKVFSDNEVILVGNESQTVGPENAPKAVHDLLLGKEVVLLEGIRLSEVPDGVYLLNAAPLNLGGSDGAPVRAILLEL